MSAVPASRVVVVNDAPISPDGAYVLYWVMAARRTRWNFALQRAAEHARRLQRPLLVFEAVRCGYRWASDRHHTFLLQGMREQEERLATAAVSYLPYVEPAPGEGEGLLEHLARRACVIVTDDYPAFFLPRAVASVAPRLPVRLETVDGNGVFPMRSTERVFTTAHSFRAFLQKHLAPHLATAPREDPVEELRLPALPFDPLSGTRWGRHDPGSSIPATVSALQIDHKVPRVETSGGARAGAAAVERFFAERLPRYAEHRNDAEREAASGLSPYLHFGVVSAHEVVHRVLREADWTPGRLGEDTRGARRGWWGLPSASESFLDQIVTWRELGFNMCVGRPDSYDRYESLPSWSQKTLAAHADDVRPSAYPLETLEAGQTHDEVWNAAQRQLQREGRIHNYLRMLWGKKVLEWSPSPRVALDRLLHLNNRWALDGRDPNSYSGVFWTFGRYDRAWGPERSIFGKVRYMSSESTRRKLKLKAYLARYGPEPALPRQRRLL